MAPLCTSFTAVYSTWQPPLKGSIAPHTLSPTLKFHTPLWTKIGEPHKITPIYTSPHIKNLPPDRNNCSHHVKSKRNWERRISLQWQQSLAVPVSYRQIYWIYAAMTDFHKNVSADENEL